LRILEEDAEIDALDRKQTTPLHLTAINGHPHIALLLLERGARIELENDVGKNALELAIDHGHKSVATAILNSTHWKEAMKTCTVANKGNLETPLRMMIRKFPDLATLVLDKCIKEKKENEFHFDFSFLEDTYNYRKKEGEKSFEYSYDCKEPYVNSALKIQNNHTLMIMKQEKQKSLLKHPLSLALLRNKWKKFRLLFLFDFAIYCLYLGLITAFVLVDVERVSSKNETTLGLNETDIFARDDPHIKTLENWLFGLRFVTTATIILSLIMELIEFIRVRKKYLNLENTIDLTLYGVALFYVWFAQLLCKDGQCWNIPVGSFLLTCSWLNLTSYGSQMPFLGIYILMLRQIVETILKLSTLIVIFLIAFGLGFHVIFSKLDTFAAVEWSLLKTIVMMIGELDYGDIFFNEDVDPLSDVSTGYAVFFVCYIPSYHDDYHDEPHYWSCFGRHPKNCGECRIQKSLHAG